MSKLWKPSRRLIIGAGVSLLASPAIVRAQSLSLMGAGTAARGSGAGASYATWNPADLTQGTLDGTNLIFTQTGAGVDGGTRIITGQTSGRYFFEVAFDATTRGADTCVGISLAGITPTNIAGATTNCAILFPSGNLWINGSNARTGATAAWISGAVTVGCLVDFGTKLISFELSSGSLSAGDSFSAISGALYPCVVFNASSFGTATGHFNPSSFVYTTPSSAVGWPL